MEFKDRTHKTAIIEQYLDGTLDDATSAEVAQMIAEDASFAKEVEDIRITTSAVQIFSLMGDLEKIREDYDREHGTPEPKRSTVVRYLFSKQMAAAASIILVGLIGFQFATVSKENVIGKLGLYEISMQTRGGGGTGTDSVTVVFEDLYKSKNFDACINYYENGNFQDMTKVVFLTGNAYLGANQPKKAIDCFERVFSLNKQNNTDIFNQHSEWYLAIAYLQDEQYKKAEELFDKIYGNERHLFNDQIDMWLYLKVKMLQLKN